MQNACGRRLVHPLASGRRIHEQTPRALFSPGDTRLIP
jgi:hypothetical protein